MKHIIKNKIGKGYAELLVIHKANGCFDDTKNNQSTSEFTRTNILNDLLTEQKYLCAYCMSKIDIHHASIEHIIGQSYIDSKGAKIGKVLDTDYNNMLAVCSGKLCDNSLHCDKSRAKYQHKYPMLYISPLNNLHMQNISFTRSGKIKYKVNDSNIENDLDKFLNLNCKTLVENRKRIKDAVKGQLIRKKFDSTYAHKQLSFWTDDKAYCQVAIQELNKYIK